MTLDPTTAIIMDEAASAIFAIGLSTDLPDVEEVPMHVRQSEDGLTIEVMMPSGQVFQLTGQWLEGPALVAAQRSDWT